MQRGIENPNFGRERREVPDARTPIIVAGLPGKMAALVAEAIEQSDDYLLVPRGISSSNHNWEQVKVGGTNIILNPFTPGRLLSEAQLFEGKKMIAVDYTNPSAVNANAELYARSETPFVMGTTGGDRQKLVDTVRNSEISAVIAPNMAPHIVTTQAMLERAAAEFPGALTGWNLSIVESHQSTKKDVSGTAKGWLPLFEQMGVSLDGEIRSIRNPEEQEQLGIREKSGHGYHWFTLKSPDGNATLQISTAVEGRTPYVAGTMMAVKFLDERIKAGSRGEVFSMVDVLRAQRTQ